MSKEQRCKITVVKKCLHEDLVKKFMSDQYQNISDCEIFKMGQEFIINNLDELVKKEHYLKERLNYQKSQLNKRIQQANKLYDRLITLGIRRGHKGPKKNPPGLTGLLTDNRFSNILAKLAKVTS